MVYSHTDIISLLKVLSPSLIFPSSQTPFFLFPFLAKLKNSLCSSCPPLYAQSVLKTLQPGFLSGPLHCIILVKLAMTLCCQIKQLPLWPHLIQPLSTTDMADHLFLETLSLLGFQSTKLTWSFFCFTACFFLIFFIGLSSF